MHVLTSKPFQLEVQQNEYISRTPPQNWKQLQKLKTGKEGEIIILTRNIPTNHYLRVWNETNDVSIPPLAI